MATIAQIPIRSQYKDGSIVISNVKSKIDNTTTSYSVVDTWYDGTPMDDSKVDQFGIYSKYKPTGEYLRENKPQWGELFLEVDTVAEFRDMTPYNQFLIKIGYFKGIRLSGYYGKGDTPGAIDYFLSANSGDDDGGSVFVVGNIKLEHDFNYYVDFRYFGINGDGDDESDRISLAITKAVGGVFFVPKPKTNYLTGQIVVPSNTNAQFESDVVWQAKDGLNIENPTFEALFRFQNTENSMWLCNGAIFRMNKDYYLPLVMQNGSSSEHNHIFMINGVTNVEIRDAISRDSGGDGFYVTGFRDADKYYSENVRLFNCKAINNKRNGLSIVNCLDFVAEDCEFNESSGTSIQSGVDIEPEYNARPGVIKNNRLYFRRCRMIGNAGKGVTLAMQNQRNDMSDYNFECVFEDCYTRGNMWGFSTQFNNEGILGKIKFVRCVAQEDFYNGFLEISSHPDMVKQYEDCVAINCNTSGNTQSVYSLASSFYVHYSATYHVDRIGGSRFVRCKSIDNRESKLIRRAFCFSAIAGYEDYHPEDFYLEECSSMGHSLQEVYISSGCKNGKRQQVFDKKVYTVGYSASIQPLNQDYIGYEIDNSGATGTASLRLPVAKAGYGFKIRVRSAQNLTLLPQEGFSIIGIMRTTASLVTSNEVGNYLELEGRSDGNWEVKSIVGNWSNISAWNTATRPTSPKIGQIGYNTSTSVQEYWNGLSWESVASSASGSWTISTGSIITSATASFAKSGKIVALSGTINFTLANEPVTITLPYAPDYGCVLIVGVLTLTLTSGSTTATVSSSVTGSQNFQVTYKTA